MDRFEKIRNLEELKKLITRKKQLIEKRENELKQLEEKYNKDSKSELPILLFSVDTTSPMPDDESDYEYRYFYYYPDLNDIKIMVGNYKKELLPNTIDLRESFKNIGMPKKFWSGLPFLEYKNETQFGVDIIKTIIDNILNNNIINTWAELKDYILINIDEINAKIEKSINHVKNYIKEAKVKQLQIYGSLANQEDIDMDKTINFLNDYISNKVNSKEKMKKL